MTIRADKTRVQVTLGNGLLAQLDAEAKARGRYRGHLIEEVLGRWLSRQGKRRPALPLDSRQIDLEEAIGGLPLSSLADKRR